MKKALILLLLLPVVASADNFETRDELRFERNPQPFYLDLDRDHSIDGVQIISYGCGLLDCARHAEHKCGSGEAESAKIVKMWVNVNGVWGWEDVCQYGCKGTTEVKGAICVETPKPSPPPRETVFKEKR